MIKGVIEHLFDIFVVSHVAIAVAILQDRVG